MTLSANNCTLLDNAAGDRRIVNIPHDSEETCRRRRNHNVAKREKSEQKRGLGEHLDV